MISDPASVVFVDTAAAKTKERIIVALVREANTHSVGSGEHNSSTLD